MMEWLTDTLQFLQMHVMPFAKLHALQIFVGVVIFIMWGWLLGIKFHKPSTVSGEVADKEIIFHFYVDWLHIWSRHVIQIYLPINQVASAQRVEATFLFSSLSFCISL